MKASSITPKQQTILSLLYTYRFLKRKQIQLLLRHTNKSRIIRWLKELREKQYIDWIYDKNNPTDASLAPAIYFLSLNGIRFLRQLAYPETELQKRYKDSDRQHDFIDRCLLLADCAIHLEARNNVSNGEFHYDYAVEANYADPDNVYHVLAQDDHVRPSMVFAKIQEDEHRSTLQAMYLVEMLNVSTPRYMTRKKIKGYIEYLSDNEWDELYADTAPSDNPPIVLITCPTLAEMVYTKRYIRKQLNDICSNDVPEGILLRVTTTDKLRTQGLTAIIWETT